MSPKERYVLSGLTEILEAEGYNVPLIKWMIERDWDLAHGKKAPPLPASCQVKPRVAVSKPCNNAIRQGEE